MANLVKWIEENTPKGDQIEGVVIGEWSGQYPTKPRNTILSWEDARLELSYEFDDGFGIADCSAIYVWTTTKILFVSQYDGATTMHAIPRNPIDCVPIMPGGG